MDLVLLRTLVVPLLSRLETRQQSGHYLQFFLVVGRVYLLAAVITHLHCLYYLQLHRHLFDDLYVPGHLHLNGNFLHHLPDNLLLHHCWHLPYDLGDDLEGHLLDHFFYHLLDDLLLHHLLYCVGDFLDDFPVLDLDDRDLHPHLFHHNDLHWHFTDDLLLHHLLDYLLYLYVDVEGHLSDDLLLNYSGNLLLQEDGHLLDHLPDGLCGDLQQVHHTLLLLALYGNFKEAHFLSDYLNWHLNQLHCRTILGDATVLSKGAVVGGNFCWYF